MAAHSLCPGASDAALSRVEGVVEGSLPDSRRAFFGRGLFDRIGLSIAAICLVHCLSTAVLLAVLASASSALLAPWVHEVGLVLAIGFGAIALLRGVLTHGYMMPAAVGATGLGMMAGALTLGHGGAEVFYTMLGVGVLALGHDLNMRAAR